MALHTSWEGTELVLYENRVIILSSYACSAVLQPLTGKVYMKFTTKVGHFIVVPAN